MSARAVTLRTAASQLILYPLATGRRGEGEEKRRKRAFSALDTADELSVSTP